MCLFLIKVIARTTEAKSKSKIYHILTDANQLVLNCKRFSYFWPFIYDIITQNTTHSNIMYLYGGHSASMSLGKEEGIHEESNKKWHRKEGVQSKKWCLSHKFFYVLFPVTQYLYFFGFSWSPNNITASNKKSISKKETTSVSEMTIRSVRVKLTN